eukprot:scaffold60014_cov67-Phaeocystis_antarctica.AAC.2
MGGSQYLIYSYTFHATWSESTRGGGHRQQGRVTDGRASHVSHSHVMRFPRPARAASVRFSSVRARDSSR